jgi:hypothetical protein
MIRLTLGRMFEATVRDRSNELVLEKEVAEAGRVDADVAALLVAGGVICSQALCCARGAVGGYLGGLDLLVGVVDEIFLVRHDGSKVGSASKPVKAGKHESDLMASRGVVRMPVEARSCGRGGAQRGEVLYEECRDSVTG